MEFVEGLKQIRQEEQDYLDSLEAGATVGRQPVGGGPHSWQDQTQSKIEESKGIIARLSAQIAEIEGS